MQQLFSDRILNTPSSFIREILKVTETDDVISFAGGLPNPVSFPSKEIDESTSRVIAKYQSKVFQYASTEGFTPLKECIARRYYEKQGLTFTADEILITTGSQQALDLIGKVLINKNDPLVIEKPAFLGAIQTFSQYEPAFIDIDCNEEGMDTDRLRDVLKETRVKLMYTVPNFQNPTGLSYSQKSRDTICELLQNTNTFLIEDDPYGDLRFKGEDLPYIAAGKLPDNSILLGSISKIITPGMRLGWLCSKNKELMQKLIIAKQASDLHSNIFAQYVIHDYITHNDLEKHIQKIRKLYKEQSNAMIQAINTYLPKDIYYTKPQGGMFMWMKLPEGCSSLTLLEKAKEKKVVFVPGDPFYVNCKNAPTLRLNYTNSDADMIEEGMKRLGEVLSL